MEFSKPLESINDILKAFFISFLDHTIFVWFARVGGSKCGESRKHKVCQVGITSLLHKSAMPRNDRNKRDVKIDRRRPRVMNHISITYCE